MAALTEPTPLQAACSRRCRVSGRRCPPVWLMRQAGRYLPEYRALRAEKGGFLALATDPEAAAEVTLQPIRRFGFDGAILFSDILMVPWALGQDLSVRGGRGAAAGAAAGRCTRSTALEPRA